MGSMSFSRIHESRQPQLSESHSPDSPTFHYGAHSLRMYPGSSPWGGLVPSMHLGRLNLENRRIEKHVILINIFDCIINILIKNRSNLIKKRLSLIKIGQFLLKKSFNWSWKGIGIRFGRQILNWTEFEVQIHCWFWIERSNLIWDALLPKHNQLPASKNP